MCGWAEVASGNTVLKIYKGKLDGTLLFAGELSVYGSWKGIKLPFNWSTDIKKVDSGLWQVSLLPFPQDVQLASGQSGKAESNPLSPPGLVASGTAPCVNCFFDIDFYPFSPEPKSPEPKKEEAKPWFSWLQEAAQGIINAIRTTAENLVRLIAPSEKDSTAKPFQWTPKSIKPTDYLMLEGDEGRTITIPPFTYYVRVVPMYQGKPAGAASNAVFIHWAETNVEAEKQLEQFKKCAVTPTPDECVYKGPPKPYQAEILSYTPILGPTPGHVGCFIVTQDATVPFWGYFTKGQTLCPPPPPEKSWFDEFVDYLGKVVNSYSFMWDAAKNAVVDFVGDIVCPSGTEKECKAGLSMAVNAGLVAVGLPPDLPNFDSLVNEGLDYYAAELARQAGIPEEVAKEGLKKSAEAFKQAKVQAAGWLPQRVPVEPDPEGEGRNTKMTVKLTRKADVPDKNDYCTKGEESKAGGYYYQAIQIMVSGTNPQAAGWGYPTAGTLFGNKSMLIPKLAPGESMTITVPLEPFFSWGFVGAKYTDQQEAAKAWQNLHGGGTAHFFVSNVCTDGEALDWPSGKSYAK